MTKVIGLVPLRAGSKGLPGKNTRNLLGKPLYRHATDQALRVLGDVVVSTDIAAILANPAPGVQVRERPANLAADSSPMDGVIHDVITQGGLQDHTIVLLQATSPLRQDDDIRQALALHETGDFDLVMSVTSTDPGFLKYGSLQGGRYVPVARPEYCFSNRQSLPVMMRPNGAIYVFRADSFLRNAGLACTNIGAFEMPNARSMDIDTGADFDAVEAVMQATRGQL
ncbi:MAG: cytidylyltransferase domain-containing protein [Planktomarina sp.]